MLIDNFASLARSQWAVSTMLAVLGLFVALVKSSRRCTPASLRFVPIPGGASFVWGHQKLVFDSSAGSAYTNWFRSLNSHVIRIRAVFWRPDILVVADPHAINHIMNRKIYNYQHSDVSRPRIERLLGRSLGWVEGAAEHKRMNQLVVHSFSWEAVRGGAQNIQLAADTMKDHLTQLLDRYGGKLDADITKLMQQATLDAIGRFAFAHDFVGGRSIEADNILTAWRSMAEVAISQAGFYGLMLLRQIPILDKLPLSVIRSQANVRKTIHAGVAQELLTRNKALMEVADADSLPDDLLYQLLMAERDGRIGRNELLDHVSMFTIAGSETTAQGLSFALWELAKHPEIQDRLRQEIDAFSPPYAFDHILSSMPFLDAVTKETLRLHPPTPYMERNAMEDDVIPLTYPITDSTGKVHTEIKISVGQTVIIPIQSVNHLNSTWGDGDAFRPDRWLSKESLPSTEITPGGWSSILTFSDGPRICTGYRLAIFEFKLFLATLISTYRFGVRSGMEISGRYASTTNPIVVGQEDRGLQLPLTITPVE